MSTNEQPAPMDEPVLPADVAHSHDGTPRANKKASWSMVIGIISLVAGLYIGLMIFGSVVAVALGFQARGEIRRSGGAQTGSGQALTGIITGFIFLAVFVLLTVAIHTGLVDVPADIKP